MGGCSKTRILVGQKATMPARIVQSTLSGLYMAPSWLLTHDRLNQASNKESTAHAKLRTVRKMQRIAGQGRPTKRRPCTPPNLTNIGAPCLHRGLSVAIHWNNMLFSLFLSMIPSTLMRFTLGARAPNCGSLPRHHARCIPSARRHPDFCTWQIG